MTSHTTDLQRIKSASSLDDIQRVVRQYSGEAPPGSRGGVLYSGRVGETKSEAIALEVADITGQPIINRTPRAQFLVASEREITESAIRIYELQGESFALARQSATNFLYGDAKAPIHSQTSLDGCLWGETSREFAGSLHGDVTLIASEAQIGRVFAVAEVPAALENGKISSLGGHSTDVLRKLARHGEASEVIKFTQDRFIKAASHGIFVSPKNVGPEISKVVISKEVAASLGLDTTPFSSAADLTTAGLKRVSTITVASPKATGASAVTTSGHNGSNASPASHGKNLTAINATDELSLALQAQRRVGTAIKGMVAGGATVLTAYDAYTTAEQYQALSAQGNPFGADALLRRYEGRTAGGFIGSFAAGAAYGLATGSETGPGAFVTGAVGGVIGAFAGDKIATMVNEHKVNHQTGTDGVTYAYEDGQWGRTQHHVQLSGVGPANPYNAPNYTSTTTPAPPEQLSQLDYQRTTAVTALALANPATQDTRHIDLDGIQWQATREGWARQVEIPGIPNSYGIPAVITVDKTADARTSEQLSQIATNRQFNNDHYAEDVSKAYVMDYYGKGWGANGPLPDVVTKALDLPSEQHIKDPVTGHVWDASGKGGFSREETKLIDKVVIREMVAACGEELTRLGQLEQLAIHSNATYGKQLIAQKFEAWHEAQRAEPADHAVTPASNHGTPSPARQEKTSPSPSVPAENSMPSKTGPTITPSSSNREMFDALMTAVQNRDIDAMRSVSQNYLQSDRGQAWLEQGHQLNQQQAQAQQAALDAQQQQTQAQQGRAMQR